MEQADDNDKANDIDTIEELTNDICTILLLLPRKKSFLSIQLPLYLCIQILSYAFNEVEIELKSPTCTCVVKQKWYNFLSFYKHYLRFMGLKSNQLFYNRYDSIDITKYIEKSSC